MTSRKSTRDRGTKGSFREKNVLTVDSNKKKNSHPKDGFFIKSSNKNTKNIALDVTGSRKNKHVAFQKEFPQRKDKDIDPSQDTVESEKKTFDKKAWRIKRYSNKHKLQQWKDVRKTHLIREYNKSIKGSNTTPFNFDENEKYMDHSETSTQQETSREEETSLLNASESTIGNEEEKSTKLQQNLVSNPTQTKLFNKRNQEDHEGKIELTENQKRKVAKQEAIKEYKRKKMEKYKKLSRKTKKGQPVMKDRIEVLLEEIQKSMGQ